MKHLSNFALALLVLSLASCKNFNKTDVTNTEVINEKKQTLYLNETDEAQKIYPHVVTDLVTSNISNHVFEGLLKFNPKNLMVMPAIAKSWEADSLGTTYTFALRNDVYFQDDACFANGKGRRVVANDFVYSFNLLCANKPFSRTFSSMFKDVVKGGNAYAEATSKENEQTPERIEGIKALNDSTLQITLEKENKSFLQILCTVSTAVIAKEAFEKYGENITVGSGPFLYRQLPGAEKKIALIKNPNYYLRDKNDVRLPYLDSIIISFIPSQSAELSAFKNEELDVVNGLPPESINEFLASEMKSFQNQPAKYMMERSPNMATQYYVFNTSKAPFNNKKLRQAISYGIDRTKIVDEILKGQAAGPGIFGIVPQTFKDYPSSNIVGYDFDVEKAKKLLAEAGYPDGKGLAPIKLELNSGGSRNTIVAFEIQKQLKNNLNIDIEFEITSLSQKMENEMMGNGDMFRTAWYADYPSPISFLTVAYGKGVPSNAQEGSFPNTSRFKNAEFDKLFVEALHAKNDSIMYTMLAKAEQLFINEAPIVVLWYDENFRLTQSKVKNYYFNAMDYRNCTEVYIE